MPVQFQGTFQITPAYIKAQGHPQAEAMLQAAQSLQKEIRDLPDKVLIQCNSRKIKPLLGYGKSSDSAYPYLDILVKEENLTYRSVPGDIRSFSVSLSTPPGKKPVGAKEALEKAIKNAWLLTAKVEQYRHTQAAKRAQASAFHPDHWTVK